MYHIKLNKPKANILWYHLHIGFRVVKNDHRVSIEWWSGGKE